MKIAITGGRSALGRALAQALGGEHEVRVAPEGDLRDEAFAKQIVEGANALIHLAALYPDLPPNASEREVLDLATQGTYALVGASVTAGAQRIVLGSTLALFERYPATWRAEESWQPLPDVRDVGQLAAYLAEESVKQFARVEPIIAIGLRFGEIVDDAATRGKRYDPRWVHLEDAVQAVQKALAYAPTHRTAWPGPGERPHQGWWVFHIAGGGEHTRFRLSAAR